MSFECYIPCTLLRSAMIGGLFVSADGTRRLVPDHWPLLQAELLDGARLLRLSCSCCTIQVAGHLLEPIFDDAKHRAAGRDLCGASKAPHGRLRVTSVVAITPAEAPFAAFERECSNA